MRFAAIGTRASARSPPGRWARSRARPRSTGSPRPLAQTSPSTSARWLSRPWARSRAPRPCPRSAPLCGTPNVEVRRMAVWALGEIESPEAVEWLTPALRDGDVEIRAQGRLGAGRDREPDGGVRAGRGARGLRRRGPCHRGLGPGGDRELDRLVDALGRAIRDSDVEVRRKAVWALGEIQDARGVAPLTQALSDGDQETRKTAVWALGEIQDPSAIPSLVRSSTTRTRRSARPLSGRYSRWTTRRCTTSSSSS